METADLIRKVRKIEIKTRGLSSQIFSGEYHSAFKGQGMAFREVREYQPGDDIRNIDWNVTARYNHPYIKIFEEEREMTVMLLVDMSASGEFGTGSTFKKDIMTEISAVLSFSAIQNNDKIGVIFFSDVIEKFIPPKKGKSHILRIIRELLELKPKHTKTDLTQALKYFTNVIKKRSITFLISDFMDQGYEDALKLAARKHDLVAIDLVDDRERAMPSMGLTLFHDPETGTNKWIDTSSAATRHTYAAYWHSHDQQLASMLNRSGIDWVKINTAHSYVQPLMNLFKRRERKL